MSNSNAAKNDSLQFGAGTYSLNDLLANDPASAVFVGFNTAGVTLNPNGTFTVAAGVTSFTYSVQMGHGNGTVSTATVTIADKAQASGVELVKNWSFEADGTADLSQYRIGNLTDWTTDQGGTTPEVVGKDYYNIGNNNNASDGHWLDTQGSPGGIDISQVISGLNAGQHAEMTFKVAAESLTYQGVPMATDPNEKLDIVFGGKVVKEVTMADFTGNGGVDYNDFHTFTANVLVGADTTLRIVSTGASQNVGFAIDSVSIQKLMLPAS